MIRFKYKFSYHYHVICLLCLALSSCSGHSDDDSDSVHRPGTPSVIEDVELADPSMRIVGDPVTLHFADGGVLFTRDSSSGVISAVRVDDGFNCTFDPSIPSLSVNGTEVPLQSYTVLKEAGTTVWHLVTLVDRRTRVLIVTDF